MLKFFLFLLAALIGLPSAGPARAAEDLLPDTLIYPGDRPGHILVVDKASQMLYLYRHDGDGTVSLDRVMPCSTGENLGDKMVEGDKKTPNGFYIFNQKLLPRELSPIYGTLAYPTDYPNFWDRRLGRGGYGIWLHGIDKPLVDYDSNGCIELENADIARLEDLLHLFDTPLITYETLTLAPVEDLKGESQAVRDFLEDWRRAWSGKDHNTYRAKYASDFVNSDNRTFEGWMTHKRNVAGNYRDIKVELKDLRIFRHRDVLVASFEQDYRGDQRFTSMGLKRLYLRPEGGGYKIIGEEFRPFPKLDTGKKLTPEEKHLALTTPPKVAPPIMAEPEGSRAAVEARAAAEDQARTGSVEDARGEEGLPGLMGEARGSLTASPEPAPAEPSEPAPPAPALPNTPAQEPADPLAEPEPAPVPPQAPGPGEERQFFTELVSEWARVWTLKDLEAYFAFYHPDFHYRAKNMNLAAFRAYRAENMTETERLEILVSDIQVQVRGERARVSFRQEYRSDQLADRGRKTLVFKKDGPDWKIMSETWRAE